MAAAAGESAFGAAIAGRAPVRGHQRTLAAAARAGDRRDRGRCRRNCGLRGWAMAATTSTTCCSDSPRPRPNAPTRTEPQRFALFNLRLSGGRIDIDDRPVGENACAGQRGARLALPVESARRPAGQGRAAPGFRAERQRVSKAMVAARRLRRGTCRSSISTSTGSSCRMVGLICRRRLPVLPHGGMLDGRSETALRAAPEHRWRECRASRPGGGAGPGAAIARRRAVAGLAEPARGPGQGAAAAAACAARGVASRRRVLHLRRDAAGGCN